MNNTLLELAEHNAVGEMVFYASDLWRALGNVSWHQVTIFIERAQQTIKATGLNAMIEKIDAVNEDGVGFADYQMDKAGAYLVLLNGDPDSELVASVQAEVLSNLAGKAVA